MHAESSTDDLSLAQRQLAASFETRSSTMGPTESSGTDIFGGLLASQALFESSPKSRRVPRIIEGHLGLSRT